MIVQMTTSYRILLAALTSLFLISTVTAQSLFDVVASLSDRQRVINQQAQVFTYLTNQNNGPADTDADLPADAPIDWLGAGTSPTQSAVDGLDIGGKIGLLNQAAVEFDRLKFAFLNSSPGEFKAGETVGVLRVHTAGDFEPLPRATPENYTELLRLLAQRVRVLRLIKWSAAFSQKEVTDQTDVDEVVVYDDPQDSDHNGNRQPRVEIHDPNGDVVESVSWKPDAIGPGNLQVESSEPVIQVGYGGGSRVYVSGSYSEDPSGEEGITAPLRTQTLRFSSSYPVEARVRATAPGGAGLQIDGTVYVLRRSHWHEFDVSSVSSRYEKNEAGYEVEGSSAGGTISLFGTTPTATFKGAWITSSDVTGGWSHNLEQTFVEKGYQHKAASVEPSGDGGRYEHSYERNWNIGCTFYPVFMPTFTRGVDDPAMRTKLDSAHGTLADNAADGNLLLHPRPSVWFGIDLGPGLKGGGNGYVSTGSIDVGWGAYGGYNGYYAWFSDYWNSRLRFDSSYSLQFAGSCSDYHVVYENDRSDRIQKLPADSMGWSYTDPSGNARYDTSTLYYAWDRPRLKQVAGRDLVADITYNENHYGGYIVKIYRRPTGSATPTPGDALSPSPV